MTEVTVVCEHFDEIATGGRSLLGEMAEECAAVRMWTRRVDLEIAEPTVAWQRGEEEAAASISWMTIWQGYFPLRRSPDVGWHTFA